MGVYTELGQEHPPQRFAPVESLNAHWHTALSLGTYCSTTPLLLGLPSSTWSGHSSGTNNVTGQDET